MEYRIKRRLAFTLVELLVVISIIALLIALLLPVLGSARESGQRAQCLSNNKMIATGALAYAADFKGRLPDREANDGVASGYAGGFHNDGLGASGEHWGADYVNHYLGGSAFDLFNHPQVMYCPSSQNQGETWRPDYQPNWRLTDYAYYPSLHFTIRQIGLGWVALDAQSEVFEPLVQTEQMPPDMPLTGDAMFRFQTGGASVEWFVASHLPSGAGVNSYTTNQSQATEPEGGHQSHYDGSARWYELEQMQIASDHRAWGSPLGAQFWAYE